MLSSMAGNTFFRKFLFFTALLAIQSALNAQQLNQEEIARLSRDHFSESLETLRGFLRLPNDGHFPDQIEANLRWCTSAFQQLGFTINRLETSIAPLLLAERRYHEAGTVPTVLFYCQIDGQPVDPQKWDQADPFEPALKAPGSDGSWAPVEWSRLEAGFDPDWRLFARSASDSKGPAICLLAALQILQQQGMRPPFNVKVIMDFQEEMSSPSLRELVEISPSLLKADALVVMDGTRHVSNLPTLTFGARGIAKVVLTVFGPRVPLHSGQYGNFAPNPAFGLARLLAGMKDETGKVIIPGFYDGIELSDAEKAVLNNIPEDASDIEREVGIARRERVGDTYQEAMQYPSLNIRGMQAAWVGEQARTIIPDRAVAELDLRLVPETKGERLLSLIRDYIGAQGYHFVDGEPTEEERRQFDKLIAFEGSVSYEAFRTEMDSHTGKFLTSALTRAFGQPPVLMRTTGGSQPIGPIIMALEIPAVAVRIPNPDNNIHSPNENLRLGNFLEGIQSCLAVLTEKY